MSLGDSRYNEGTKKSRWKYEFASLTQLSSIAAAVAGGATEATLLAVLATLQSEQEFEQNLVMDLGGAGCPGACPTYLQIRIFNTDTHTFDPPIYYDATGAVVVPVGPLEIVNPQYVLANILTQITAINADLDVALSTRASEVTLAALSAAFTAEDFATQTTLAAVLTAIGTTNTEVGATNEAAAGTDTAVSGLNGLIKRLLQRHTTQFPAALVSGRFDINNGAWLGSTAPSVGQKAMTSSIPVVIASDQTHLPVTAAVNTTLTNLILSFRNTAITNTAVAVKGLPGNVWGWNLINSNVTPVYLKIYNVAAASVTVGVTVPIMTLMIPGSGSVYQGPASTAQLNGAGSALSIACVTTVADSGSTAPATALHVELKYT